MNDLASSTNLAKLIDQWGTVGIKSTGASLVNYSGVLYNVDGSSTDPQIDGNSWKRLLLSHGIDEPCYVANQTPAGNSHPDFNVGGHMTPKADGFVEVGTDSYLMPLCSWHNSKARDGVAFQHDKTLVLKLSGFMQSEIAASFMARLPSEESFAIVYSSGGRWENANLTAQQAAAVEAGNLPSVLKLKEPSPYVLLERKERENQSRYFVRKSDLPK